MDILKHIPVIDADSEDFAEQLEFNVWSTHSSTDTRNDRERPYDGQPWTDDGERGKTEVKGLTMRDIADCFIKAVLQSSVPDAGDELDHALDKPGRKKMLWESVEDNTWRYQDIYKVDLSKVDPSAIQKHLTCEIEKMMGIFPNVLEIERLFDKTE